MHTIHLRWKNADGTGFEPARGTMTAVPTRRWVDRADDSIVLPEPVSVLVDGTGSISLPGSDGDWAWRFTWRPADRRVRGWSEVVLVPAGDGESEYVDLLAVDPSTLEPLAGDDLVTAVDLMARAEALTARIESGEFTGEAGADGADGVSVESITDDDGDGVATVRLSSGVESPLPLPRGPQGERGERGLTGEQGVKGDRGDTGPAPEVSWSGDRLTVGGQTGPSLTGPQGVKGDQGPQGDQGDQGDRGPQGLKGDTGATGPATTLTIGTVTDGATAGATLTGEAPAQTLSLVLPKGDTGDRGPQGIQGPPGVVSSASSYVIVGPGRPDQPATTAGVIASPDTTPVGAEYRSTDGASVGAWTWRKRGTGWVVTDGDTGWRDMTEEWKTSGNVRPEAAASSALMRRTQDSVTVWPIGLPLGGSATPGVALPAGFTGAIQGKDIGTSRYGLANSDQTMCRVWLRNRSRLEWITRGDATVYDMIAFPTADAWPTTLPGSPA